MVRHGICVLALLLCSAGASLASIIPFTGEFNSDDDVVTFYYTVQSLGPVNVYTTSFATGGFAPILSLFDSTGAFQFSSDGATLNDCVNNATDPATGACYDAWLSWNSLANVQYIVTLTQYGNYSIGPTLADGFTQQGTGNFTAEPPFNPSTPGGSFLLPGPIQRTAAWAISFDSADPTLSVTQVPEPASGLLLLGGMALVAGWKRSRKGR